MGWVAKGRGWVVGEGLGVVWEGFGYCAAAGPVLFEGRLVSPLTFNGLHPSQIPLTIPPDLKIAFLKILRQPDKIRIQLIISHTVFNY